MHRIPQKDKQKELARLVFLVEISNFTEYCLKGKDLSITHGNQEPLIFWDANEHEDKLPIASMLKDFESFVIPPFGKERLVFRCSGRTLLHKSRLTGLMTMQIGEIGDNFQKKMMIQFRIDGGNFKSSYNRFSVGFPDVGIDSDEMKFPNN